MEIDEWDLDRRGDRWIEVAFLHGFRNLACVFGAILGRCTVFERNPAVVQPFNELMVGVLSGFL